MATGRTHETINLVALGALAAGYVIGTANGVATEFTANISPQMRLVFGVSYLIGTFLVTPDLDLAEGHVRAKSNWGLLGLLWVPYGLIFRHRGLSHTWLVGPLTRLLYMVMLGLVTCSLISALGPYLGYTFSIEAQLSRNWLDLAVGALAGYYLSQWLHLIADGLWPDPRIPRGRRRTVRRR
ncbi:MAG: metal-binding protein [Trueperaceae bacterium]|nr:MAG: metal-binding protein [Trueperaceae bacterium]